MTCLSCCKNSRSTPVPEPVEAPTKCVAPEVGVAKRVVAVVQEALGSDKELVSVQVPVRGSATALFSQADESGLPSRIISLPEETQEECDLVTDFDKFLAEWEREQRLAEGVTSLGTGVERPDIVRPPVPVIPPTEPSTKEEGTNGVVEADPTVAETGQLMVRPSPEYEGVPEDSLRDESPEGRELIGEGVDNAAKEAGVAFEKDLAVAPAAIVGALDSEGVSESTTGNA
ncbi:MAG: hypothetical protein OXF02_06300 [Simkaniaceae bacterium]|nr:hypothetical protein [Simkaniaceae bacterium]